MKHLRNKLDEAQREYDATRYRGNLARDVLGADVIMPTARRRDFMPLAIAAALAVGLSVGIFVGRSTSDSTPTPLAINTPTTAPAVVDDEPIEITAVATTDNPAAIDAAVEDEFTVVPTASTFADASVSVVPDLASLAASDDTPNTASATEAVASAAFAPMSLLLLSAEEYGEQQAAADATTPSQATPSLSSPRSNSLLSEERS